MEQYAALEKFDQDPDLAELERQLSEFNLFTVMGQERRELTHSNILAWLLDPQGNHGLGDGFLSRFLHRTGIEMPDLSADKVFRERYRTDILLIDEKSRFLCVIENKIDSEEHGEQLTCYRKTLEGIYPDFIRRYLFLSPRGTVAYNATERKYWKAVDYGAVCRVVEETVASHTDSVSEDVRVFLRQYAKALRRHILGDKEVRELAEKIGKQHKEAIALINQQSGGRLTGDRPTQVGSILRELVESNQWVLGPCSRSFIRFLPEEWESHQPLQTGNGWEVAKHLVLFEFYQELDALKFKLTIGPGPDQSVRGAIYSCLRSLEDILVPGVKSLRRKWNTFTIKGKGKVLDAPDFEHWEEDAIRAKIEAWVTAFAENECPRIRDAVIQCLTEFEAVKEP